MVVNFYNHFDKSIFKSAIISLCVYFALCSVTRESVLQGSSKHKAMSTVQNRHFQKYLSLIRALLNMLILPFTSNMTEKTQTKKLNKTKISFSVHIEKYENTWGVWFFLAWFYAMLSSRDKMKSGINLDYGVDSSKCRNVTENLTLLLTADAWVSGPDLAPQIWVLQSHKVLSKSDQKQKGDGGLKILQKEIGGIQICVEIFQKNFLNAFLGVHSYIMN